MTEAVIPNIARRVKRLQEEKGVSQKQLAADIDVRQGTMSRYLNEETDFPVEVIKKLADYFGVSCDYLIRGYDAHNQSVGADTGLDNNIIEQLRSWHKNSPDYDRFTAFLLGGKNYWSMNSYIREYTDALTYTIRFPEVATIFEVDIASTDKARFARFQAVDYFTRLLDEYGRMMLAEAKREAQAIVSHEHSHGEY